MSTAAHSQHWLCSRMNKQNRLTSPFPEHTTAMQKFCPHWPSMHATVDEIYSHAVFWVEYFTSDWTVIARSWPEQICVSTGCCWSNFTFWVTWTIANIYFLNYYPILIADGAKEIHTSLQLAYILLKSDKETLHFEVYAWCMKPICSVGTNAAKCVSKLHTMNAVLILIALDSKIYSLHVSFSDICKV